MYPVSFNSNQPFQDQLNDFAKEDSDWISELLQEPEEIPFDNVIEHPECYLTETVKKTVSKLLTDLSSANGPQKSSLDGKILKLMNYLAIQNDSEAHDPHYIEIPEDGEAEFIDHQQTNSDSTQGITASFSNNPQPLSSPILSANGLLYLEIPGDEEVSPTPILNSTNSKRQRYILPKRQSPSNTNAFSNKTPPHPIENIDLTDKQRPLKRQRTIETPKVGKPTSSNNSLVTLPPNVRIPKVTEEPLVTTRELCNFFNFISLNPTLDPSNVSWAIKTFLSEKLMEDPLVKLTIGQIYSKLGSEYREQATKLTKESADIVKKFPKPMSPSFDTDSVEYREGKRILKRMQIETNSLIKQSYASRAMEVFLVSAKKQNCHAMLQLAILYHKQNNPYLRYCWTIKAASYKYIPAIKYLKKIYEEEAAKNPDENLKICISRLEGIIAKFGSLICANSFVQLMSKEHPDIS